MVVQKIIIYIKSLPKPLVVILMFALVVRIVGIVYGLPLWLIDDEPPFVLAAIKMIQLHSLIPALHQAEFAKLLYYPPYLAYLYVIPFTLVLGIQYIFHHSLGAFFIPFVVSNLSVFFVLARFVTILFSLASIVLLYEVGKNIFRSKRIGLLAAFFLSTSLLHIILSFTSRHWLIVSFFGLFVLWILSNPKIFYTKKYILASIATGIGMGFGVIIGTYLVLIGAWYLFCEKVLVSKKNIAICIVIFSILSALPMILYPKSLGFMADITTQSHKTFIGVLESPILFLQPVAFSEPLLVSLAVLGLGTLLFIEWRYFLVFFLLLYSYSALFYIVFRYEHRFAVGLLPFIVLLAAFGFDYIITIVRKRWIYVFLLVPVIFSVQLARIISNNDSRVSARSWIEENIPAHAKIFVYARLTRLPSEAVAISEQNTLDSGSLRKVDDAEKELPPSLRNVKTFHALNLYSVNNKDFYDHIAKYSQEHRYQYLLISDENFMRGAKEFNTMQKLGKSGTLMKNFGSETPDYSIASTQLLGSPWKLLQIKEFGPPLSLYKITK